VIRRLVRAAIYWAAPELRPDPDAYLRAARNVMTSTLAQALSMPVRIEQTLTTEGDPDRLYIAKSLIKS